MGASNVCTKPLLAKYMENIDSCLVGWSMDRTCIAPEKQSSKL